MKAEGRDLSIRTLRLVIGLAGLVLFGAAYLAVTHLRAPASDPAPVVDGRPAPEPGTADPQTDSGAMDPEPRGARPWRSTVPIGTGTEVADVGAVLAAADRALEEGRLIEPEGDNALDRYLDILRVEPENEAATDGVHAIVVKLMTRLQDRLDERDVAAAAELFPLLNSLIPEDPELATAGDRLERLEHAAELLALGREDLEQGSLIDPPRRNALARLKRAAELDPADSRIADSLVRLKRRMVDAALAAARQFDFGRSDRLIAAAESIREDSSAVEHARESIAQYRAHQIESAAEDARLAMRSSRFDEAARAIAQARSLGAEQNLVASLDEELRLSRIYSVHRPGEVFRDQSPLGELAPEMVVIPAGGFLMGAADNDPDRRSYEGPRHLVEFARGFAIARTETTVAQFRAFVRATGHRTMAEEDGRSHVYLESTGRIGRKRGIDWQRGYNGRRAKDDDPVVHVSWHDANAYAEWLATVTGNPYRLPTEAEFEYVLRGGRDTRYWWGTAEPTEVVENLTGADDESPRDRFWANAFPNYNDGHWGPAPVGSFLPNPFGVYDMAGNVQEWVLDCWHDSYVRAPADGSAWVNRGCSRRVTRGGFWGGPPATARASHRVSVSPDRHDGSIGFRVARDLVILPARIAGNQ